MTVETAIETVRQAGSVELVGGAIRYEIRRRSPEIAEALAILKAHKPEVLDCLSAATIPSRAEPMESVLKGSLIELWSDAAGNLFLVADEADARLAIERLGARRGEIYTTAEARRIIAVRDPDVVAEIHDWKRRFDGVIRELSDGDHLK